MSLVGYFFLVLALLLVVGFVFSIASGIMRRSDRMGGVQPRKTGKEVVLCSDAKHRRE